MKHIILILLFSSISFSFEDVISIMLKYTGFEKEDIRQINNSNIPAPEYTSYLVDNENINNGVAGGNIALNLYPMTKDSIRHASGHKDFLEDYRIYDQFKRLDSSWIEVVNGRLVITVWPQKKLGDEWCTSLVLTGDSGQTWDSLEVQSEPFDLDFVGATFTFKHKIYNGKVPYVDPYVAIGTAYINYSDLYDREAYADSIRQDSIRIADSLFVLDSIRVVDSIAVADSIQAYEDSVFAYEDSIRIADSIAVADSIKAYEDSLKTSIVLFRKKEVLKSFRRYDILGRRVNWVGRIKKIIR